MDTQESSTPESLFAQFAQYKNADSFLDHLSENGNISESCKLSGLARRDAYRYRESDASFKAAWDKALQIGIDAMEDEAVRRATQGVDKPIYYKGCKVDTVKEYSDTLLIFLLKGKRPTVYKDRTDITSNGETIKVYRDIDLDKI
jgi:hypothetical protein